MNFKITVLLALLSISGLSCKLYYGEMNPEQIELPPPLVVETPSYSEIDLAVFKPYCLACHGAGAALDFSSYAKVKSNLLAIESSVLERNGRLRIVPFLEN